MTPVSKNPKAIGHIITWQSPVVVMLGALRNALIDAGLDADLARDLHNYSKLARTARSMARRDQGERRIARPVIGERKRQLTRETEVTGGLTYDREAMLAVTDNGVLQCDAPELADKARDTFAAVSDKRTASDVTRLIKQIVEKAGSDLMPLREQGGVYFVPSGHRVIAQLEKMLPAIGGSLRKFDCTMGDGSEAGIASVVSEYLLNEITALRESVAELDDDARESVKARRMERLAELRAKLSAYETLLSASAGSVKAALESADKAIVAKLTAK